MHSLIRAGHIESAQSKVEGHNFDIRKHVVEFDDVINRQRAVTYGQRERYLREDKIGDTFVSLLVDEASGLIQEYGFHKHQEINEIQAMLDSYHGLIGIPGTIAASELVDLDQDVATSCLIARAKQQYLTKVAEIGQGAESQVIRWILLQTLDYLWIEHLSAIEELRQGISLVAYGQQDPLVAFKKQGFDLFRNLQQTFRHDSIERFFKLAPKATIETRTVLASSPREPFNGSTHGRAPDPATVPASSPEKKVGRNEPCWCGSGMKFKRCHGR